jgi:hypothetical protein
MELASMLAGERFSDRPGSVCPVIGAILRAYNDNTEEVLRQDLYRYASEVVGTRASFELQCRRATVALAWGRARYDVRGRLRRQPSPPDPDWSPDLVAEYVIRSLGRRITADVHTTMLGLIDELIALGSERELIEHLPEPVEDRCGSEEVLVAEPSKRSAPARLELLPAPLDYLSATLGQRRQDQALVLV